MSTFFSPVVQTSGQVNFSPSGGDFILTAFDRIQVRLRGAQRNGGHRMC